jgi:dephospho-CoA kinase
MIIGLTGGFSTGKTTIAKMFREKKALVIDADKLTHEATSPKTKVWEKIISHFEQTILQPNGRINRKKLGSIVFKDKKELKWLSEVIHPPVISKIKALIKSYKKLFPKRLIVIDAPLLVEARLNSLVDKIIVVNCSLNKQIARAQLKTGLSQSEILRRINSQLSLAKKIKLADFVINNNRSVLETKKQVEKIYQEVK